ncbi:hypothetical protein J4573_40385 [Actinomadura barringtoniae]|uniref:Uncharacterized protein n=1 Tax=Actinomadura barringtoniae TaxID=1427535 RepID=A0A939PJF9_9ACTN|nr:hypothetical protein [Actinomadura barringtoniae]MBO2453407.1 hypothetical protein [Actinomadura barringtoniae]
MLIIGPIIIALALITWLAMTVYGWRKRPRPDRIHGESSHRGAVQGGIIEGDPGQRNRRDEAPRIS